MKQTKNIANKYELYEIYIHNKLMGRLFLDIAHNINKKIINPIAMIMTESLEINITNKHNNPVPEMMIIGNYKPSITYNAIIDLFKEFVVGYREHGILTRKEVEAIPDLIILRVLSNVVYFVGRAVSGEDKIDSLTTRAKTYYTRVQWLKSNNDRLVQLIDEIMRPKMGKNY